MQTYRIATPVSGSVSLSGHGVVEFDFKAGDVTAKDAKDVEVLAHLASIGLAVVAEPEAVKPSKPAKPAADDAAPATVKE